MTYFESWNLGRSSRGAAQSSSLRTPQWAGRGRLGQCTQRAAHRTTSGADDQRLASLRVNDFDQAILGGYAKHADGSDVGSADLMVCAKLCGIDHAVLLPPAKAENFVAYLEVCMAANPFVSAGNPAATYTLRSFVFRLPIDSSQQLPCQLKA